MKIKLFDVEKQNANASTICNMFPFCYLCQFTISFPHFQLTGISISPGTDQLCILHLRTGNDLVLCLTNNRSDERVGEIVGTLCKLWQKYVPLQP